MSQKLIEKDYKKKIKLLNEYNRKYYNENAPTITDADYDKLKKK